MKLRLLFPVILWCVAVTSYSQSVPSKSPLKTPDFQSVVKNEVETTIRSYMSGFSSAKCNNVTPVSKFVRDDMIYVGSNYIYTISLSEYEEGLRELVCGWVSHSGTVDSIVVEALSMDVAVAAWLYHDEYKLKSGKVEKVKGSVLMTLVRSPDGWKITATKQESVIVSPKTTPSKKVANPK